jgi:6-carboxyhexanoate--CoA ligase
MQLVSVRMRASRGGPHEEGGVHVSGAERLVPPEEVDAVVLELLARAEQRKPPADYVRLRLDPVELAPEDRIPCPAVRLSIAVDPDAARREAQRLLAETGASDAAIETAFRLLTEGECGAPRRGAVLLDRRTGDRLEPDPLRGVRISRVDYAPDARLAARAALEAAGLAHFRTLEALAIAAKALWAGVLAELCWSDDSDYRPGYLALAGAGYVRFPCLRPGQAVGGRVCFVDPAATPVPDLVERLSRHPVWIGGSPEIGSL